MKLIREIRCYPGGLSDSAGNSWAGTAQGTSLGAFRVLRAVVEGPVDRRTGYLCDIKEIDRLFRAIVVPTLRGAADDALSLFLALADAFSRANKHWWMPTALLGIEMDISPHTTLTVSKGDLAMMHLTQSFEFSAAHRLFCRELSDSENLRLFGKCSNPNGHGHNYVLEVTVCGRVGGDGGTGTDLGHLDRVVVERVIEPFDHKNLNIECPEFAELNPSVENIARVIWMRLEGAFQGCRLESVRVWETPRTCAEYTGGDD